MAVRSETDTNSNSAKVPSNSELLKEPIHNSCGECSCCTNDTCIQCANAHEGTERNDFCDFENRSIKYYTLCQVRRHNSVESAWIVAGDDIYDATAYMNQHPGGSESILRRAGGTTDCTEDLKFHSRSGRKVWKKYHIGKIKECPTSCTNQKQWWQFWV